MPPTKITRSARHAPKPKGPVFPIRKPKLVTAADAQVAPINAGKVRAHYTRQGWLMWGIMGLCAVLGVFFSQQIIAAAQWVHLQASERAYVDVGRDICSRPLMTVPEYTCTVGELDCWTVPQEATIKRYEQQARAHNLWQAESCIPLM
jgi:hypothetical protein